MDETNVVTACARGGGLSPDHERLTQKWKKGKRFLWEDGIGWAGESSRRKNRRTQDPHATPACGAPSNFSLGGVTRKGQNPHPYGRPFETQAKQVRHPGKTQEHCQEWLCHGLEVGPGDQAVVGTFGSEADGGGGIAFGEPSLKFGADAGLCGFYLGGIGFAPLV
jgi:hypothetical protein